MPLWKSTPAWDRLAAELAPVQFEDLTEHLVRQMKGWVVRGLVKPGERLPPERELASLLNISRPSLRQALKVLQVMGVLETRQGSGNYLTDSALHILREPTDLLIPLRGVSFGELFEARRATEGESAAAAAERASHLDLEKLHRELERMRAHLRDPDAYVGHDVNFHRQIALASGNGIFVWIIELASKMMSEGWLARAREGNTTRTFAEHERIFHAIKARDPESARQAMLQHLTLTKFYSTQKTPMELRVVSGAREWPAESLAEAVSKDRAEAKKLNHRPAAPHTPIRRKSRIHVDSAGPQFHDQGV